MKTRLFKMFAFTLVFIGLNATAQTRYIDNIFDSVTVTSDVVYGQNVTILPMLQQQPPASCAAAAATDRSAHSNDARQSQRKR